MPNETKEAAITLLHVDYARFLLQLRDLKDWIPYPGHWGAFGGEVESHESPEVASRRELKEELGFVPETTQYFRDYYLDSNVNLHVFYSEMTVPLSDLRLMEGLDMGLFSLEEIYSLSLYSQKMGKKFPVPPLLGDFFRDFSAHVSSSRLERNDSTIR